jgi:hypothetical protein
MALPEPDPDGAYLLSTIVIGNNQEYRIDQPPASANLASLLAGLAPTPARGIPPLAASETERYCAVARAKST